MAASGVAHQLCVCRSDHTRDEKESTIEELVREITALWQTDELRRQKPSALDGAGPLARPCACMCMFTCMYMCSCTCACPCVCACPCASACMSLHVPCNAPTICAPKDLLCLQQLWCICLYHVCCDATGLVPFDVATATLCGGCIYTGTVQRAYTNTAACVPNTQCHMLLLKACLEHCMSATQTMVQVHTKGFRHFAQS